jgi:hypothetical protein
MDKKYFLVEMDYNGPFALVPVDKLEDYSRWESWTDAPPPEGVIVVNRPEQIIFTLPEVTLKTQECEIYKKLTLSIDDLNKQ